MPAWHGQPQKTRYAFTVSGIASTFGGVANDPPVWQNVPHITFFVGITSTFPISGTYQSNNYVTDANFDTIVITKNNVFVQGVNWDGGKFTSNGTGSQTTVTGHILTADDGHNSNVASSAFQIAIIPGVISWTSVPSVSFVEGSTTGYSLGQNVLNYSAATDSFAVTPGYTLPSWLSLSGTGNNILTPNGAQVDADDFDDTPGIKIRVTRSGGTPVDSTAFGVTVLPIGIGAFGYKEIATTPNLTSPFSGTTTGVYFGKQWTWDRNSVDGRFYQFGGDGGEGYLGGQSAQFFRYDPVAKVLDKHYPRWGEGNNYVPIGGDAVMWFHRNAGGRNEFHAVDGFYDNQVNWVRRNASVVTTVPAGQTVEVEIQSRTYNEFRLDSASFDVGWYAEGGSIVSSPPSPTTALPAGVLIDGQPGFVGPSHGARWYQVNALGNRSGHGDDHAYYGFYIYNSNAVPTLVSATAFTCTLGQPSNFTFTGTPSELPFTIPALTYRFLRLPVPSYNEDPNKWYVSARSGPSGISYYGCKPQHKGTFPAGITVQSVISKINYWGSYDGPSVNAASSVYPYGDDTAEVTLLLTNSTGSPINVNTTADVSVASAGDYYNYGATFAGFAGKGGAWKYVPGSPGAWTWRRWLSPSPFSAGERMGIAYDSDQDCAWIVAGNAQRQLVRYNIDADTVTNFNITGITVYDSPYAMRSGQVYVPATQEVLAINCLSLSSTNPTQVIAVSVAAATRGQGRVVANLPPFGTSADYSSLGMIRMALVASRNLVVICTPDWLDFGNYTGQAAASNPHDGGFFLVNYVTGSVEHVSYPGDAIMDQGTGEPTVAHDGSYVKGLCSFGYSPEADVIWGAAKNNTKILHWGWESANLPAYISSKAINSWIDVPKSRIATTGFGPYQDTPGVNNFPYQTFLDAGLIGGGGLFHAPGYYNSVNFPSGYYGGTPLKNIFGFSGFGFRRASGEIIWAATGGGRDCWNGNDITSIKVFDESPSIAIRVQPSNASQLWPMQLIPGVNNPTATMRDGRPNTSHTYWQTQFIDASDKLLKIGHKQNWQTDDTFFKTVQRWDYGASDWSAASAEPDLTMSGVAPGFDNFLTVTDPTLGDSYMMWNFFQLYKRDNTIGSISLVPNFGSPPNTATNGGATLDGIRFEYGFMVHWRWNGQHGLFGVAGRIPDHTTTHIWWMFNLTTNQFMNITTVNGDPDVADGANYESFPLAFDYDAGEFYISSGPGTAPFRLWKITPDWVNTISFSSFTPATTYAQPFQEIGIPDVPSGYTGPHMWVERGCLIMVASTRDPFKVIRLR